jgi:uncharacterized protein (UPF0276 family)
LGLVDHAVGLGFRPALAFDLLRQPSTVDFVEVVAETCLVSPAAKREACALAEVWPVLPHGVKLSLGSASGIDEDKARQLGALAGLLRAPVVTEHAAFTAASGVEIGHLTQLPRTRAAIAVLKHNVDRARRHFSVPLLLENVAWTWRWPDDEMDEGSFYAEVVAATGCDLLLDLSNLRANALNEGRDPVTVLESFPLERVALVHIAGGVFVDGFFYDNHAASVPEGVFALLQRLVARVGPRPVLLERDGAFPPFEELAAELEHARTLLTSTTTTSLTGKPAAPAPAFLQPATEATTAVLATAQRHLAERLTAPTLDGFGVSGAQRTALERARGVLARKRVDDALPLLPHLSCHGDGLAAWATATLTSVGRSARRVAVSDAVHLARAAGEHERWIDDARRDLLHLRARFRGTDEQGGAPLDLVPRRGPFVGGERLQDGRRCLVVKGPGTHARLHHLERRPGP